MIFFPNSQTLSSFSLRMSSNAAAAAAAYLHDLFSQLQDLIVFLLEEVIEFDDSILKLFFFVCRSFLGRLQGHHLLPDRLHRVRSSFLRFGRHGRGGGGGGVWLECGGGDGGWLGWDGMVALVVGYGVVVLGIVVAVVCG